MRLTFTAALVLASSTGAFASPLDWEGFYFGLNGGFAAGSVDLESSYDEADHSLAGATVGVQAGYNTMLQGNWVLGVQGSLSWSGLSGEALVDEAVAPWGDQFEGTQFRWVATFAPRIGYLFDENTMLYALGGLSVANFDAVFHDDTGTDVGNQSRIGAVVGAGIEYALDDKWSVGAEYNLSLYGSGPRYNGLSTYNATMTTQAILFNVNYHTD